MKIVDLHCDVLYKMQNQPELSFKNSKQLDVNFENMRQGNIKLQAFAIFLEPDVPDNQKYGKALEQIEIYHQKVLTTSPLLKPIKNWSDIHKLATDEIGTFLTLEGVECIGHDLNKLDDLIDQGVLSVGLTWNPANLAADGIGEPRGGGLTKLGFDIVHLLNNRGVLTDVSHLSRQAFWDVMQVADYPIASHSNVLQLCDHPRNLDNRQIKKMIQRRAPIHLVFNPPFTANTNNVTIEDLIEHIDYLLDMGAKYEIGLGSDFDGINSYIKNLTNASQTKNLIKQLSGKYDPTVVAGVANENFIRYVEQIPCKKYEEHS